MFVVSVNRRPLTPSICRAGKLQYHPRSSLTFHPLRDLARPLPQPHRPHHQDNSVIRGRSHTTRWKSHPSRSDSEEQDRLPTNCLLLRSTSLPQHWLSIDWRNQYCCTPHSKTKNQ